ncbi:hypothetical protein DOTSEDRAFT_73512 [Dothistroma septosporum NZE10]|uniref:Uncharacterized protein n=1 Tax=Dothistroma septosporum (strain NZE10 / CBS 128990) TaxID=675120 RepID=N1PJI3_DOTSN|nr:hypothetical protein DOTSEDRAFT_73512 [Dothistroma septosporum NZE10]
MSLAAGSFSTSSLNSLHTPASAIPAAHYNVAGNHASRPSISHACDAGFRSHRRPLV